MDKISREPSQEASSTVDEPASGIMGKVLAKLKKGKGGGSGDSPAVQHGEEILDSEHGKEEGPDGSKVKRTGQPAPRKRQEIFEDAIGQIEDDDGRGHGNVQQERPEFMKYIQPPGLETQLDAIYQWNVVDLIYETHSKDISDNL